MVLPSFDCGWLDGKLAKPRISMLEIRDRDKPESDPILWLFIERQESYRIDEQDSSVCDASIRLFYEAIAPDTPYYPRGKGSFLGGYSRGFGDEPSVSLTSDSFSSGAVFLDLSGFEGQGIGTYLMNEIVLWARRWPEAIVCPVELLSRQAYPENKSRRNHFYEQFGLVFDYRDPERNEGISRPMLAASLTPVDVWAQNIREMDVRECFAKMLSEHTQAALMSSRYECYTRNLSQELKDAEAHPVRWILQRLWQKIISYLQIG